MEAVGARAYTSHRQAGWVDWTTCISLLLYLYLRPTEYCVLSIGGAAWATSQSTYSPPASQSQQPEIGLGSFFCIFVFLALAQFFYTFVFLGPSWFFLLGLALDSIFMVFFSAFAHFSYFLFILALAQALCKEKGSEKEVFFEDDDLLCLKLNLFKYWRKGDMD